MPDLEVTQFSLQLTFPFHEKDKVSSSELLPKIQLCKL